MDITAIIVSYNVKYFLAQTVLSLFRAATQMQLEVIVVDNDSHDGSIPFLKKIFAEEIQNQRLAIIENTENVGFGQANNQALRIAKGDYVLYVNPDTLIGEDTLQECLAFLRTHVTAGAVGVRMLHGNGRFALESRRGTPTPFTAFCKMFGLARLFPRSRVFGHYYLRYMDDSQSCPIDIVSGAFMMVARNILNQLQGFDERFFMYGEDIDLSYRIKQLGYQNYYLPTRILHYKGESTNKSSRRYVNLFYQAMAIFFRKHYQHAFWLWLPVYAGIYVMSFRAVVMQNWRKLRRRFSGKNTNSKYDYLFVGSSDMHRKAAQLCEAHHINGQFLSKAEFSMDRIGEQNNGTPTIIYYDMSEFSVKEILRQFDGQPNSQCYIGTYFVEENILLPEFDV